jgi:hypothetical protein
MAFSSLNPSYGFSYHLLHLPFRRVRALYHRTCEVRGTPGQSDDRG